MSTTVAAIAKKAFNNVSAAITDAIQEVTVTTTEKGTFNAITGQHDLCGSVQSGRLVVDTVTPIGDLFSDYVAGPADELVLVEGVSSVKEGDTLTYAGVTKTVRRVQDIVRAGSLFYAVVN